MCEINTNYLNIKESYLFSDIAHRIAEYELANPGKNVIRMGIGDVTLPLPAAVVDQLHAAADEMSKQDTFKGYGPEQGYDFFRNSVKTYYESKGVSLEADEIFASDGAKSDLGNILDLFSANNTVLIPDPVYPVYVDTNIMDGRKIILLPSSHENGYLPMPPQDIKADIIYLCSPNNPTGAVYTRTQLEQWVKYAKANSSIILFDAAYEAFIADKSLPGSIYLIDGAKSCCIEFCSFSKTAGFTGLRCGYTVVPHGLTAGNVSLNKLWLRRQTTKFNGVSYVVQRAAAAVFSPEGQTQIRENIDYYRKNALIITAALDRLAISYCGGKNSPYIWLRCPQNMGSWEFFDFLLDKANIAGTPGEGFGSCGRGCFRLTAFSSRENTILAMERLEKALKKD